MNLTLRIWRQKGPRERGRMRQDFGSGFTVEGRVTAWEPGRRLAFDVASQPRPMAD